MKKAINLFKFLFVLPIIICNAETSQLFTDTNKNVKILTNENFEQKVVESSRIWVINFYKNGCKESQKLVDEINKLGELFEGIVKIGVLEIKNEKTMKKYGIKIVPEIQIFLNNKKTPIVYKGKKDHLSIANFVHQQIIQMVENRIKNASNTAEKSKKTNSAKKEKKEKKPKNSKKENKNEDDGKVIILTENNFDKLVINSKHGWMVEFFAPWCGHCQRLEPEWKSAAKQAAGIVKFGAVDATIYRNLAARFGVNGFPTIKFFAPGSNDNDAEDYPNQRTASALVEFAKRKAEDFIVDVELFEAINQNVVNENCSGKQLCIFAFLPPLLDCQSECRNKHIQLLKEVTNSFGLRKWGWFWSEGGSQPHIEAAFNVGGFGYPALSIVSPRKMKYSTMKGSFSKSSILEFLNGINFGRLRVENVSPNLLDNDGFLKVETIEEWNGEDAEIPQIEEIDLSDVELDNINEL